MNNIFDCFRGFNGHLIGEYDCRENCLLRVYDNVSKSDFTEYESALEADGFNMLQKRELNGNLFFALKKDIQVNLFFTPCDSTLRITACPDDLSPNFSPRACYGECTTTFYAFENDHTLIDCGMCLMVQCPDYSFFVVDSGHYFQMNDNDRIYKFMRDRTPAGQKVVINGWLITHVHSDHISKLIDFLKFNTEDVVIEGFYQNLLSADYCKDEWGMEENELSVKTFEALDKYPAPVYKLHTGQRFYIRNLCFDVLGTQEDIFPDSFPDYNDSSCVVMLTAEGSKIFIPGDASAVASKRLEQRFGENLKCDIVQVSHHGHSGLSANCYSLLSAKVAVFPVTRIMFDEEINRQEANRKAVELADSYFITSDGTVVIPLPYKNGNITTLPDETFEDFEKIKRLWGYSYSEERKEELYNIFIEHGGKAENLLLPTNRLGFIEPKPNLD